MAINIIIFIAGVWLLYYGAEWLVKGSSLLAKDLGVKPIVIGLTIIAICTSSPELVVSLLARIKGSDGIAVGNVVGSNICNIGLILGVSALIYPLKVQLSLLKRELPIMIASTGILFLMGRDLMLNRIEGVILFVGMIIFFIYLTLDSRMAAQSVEIEREYAGLFKNRSSLFKNVFFIIFGLGGLVLGSHLMVKSAIFIAKAFGISEWIIGLTVVAVGTSLPELATSVVATLRKEVDIAIGNIIGSNICNILLILGICAIVQPLSINKGALWFDFPWMIFFSIVLLPFLLLCPVLKKGEGLILLFGYVIFIAITFYR